MNTVKRKLVTIVAEAVLERWIEQDMLRLGIHGYTVVEARGAGAHGVRSAESEQDRNVRIEAICEERVAEAVVQHLFDKYSQNYAMVLYLTDVEVIRPGKF